MLDIERRSFLLRIVNETDALRLLAVEATEPDLAVLLMAAHDEARVRLAALPPEVWKD